MRVRLVHVRILHDDVARREERLDVERLTVGRGTDNTVQLPGLDVSIYHCRLRSVGNRIELDPLETRSVWINGHTSRGGALSEGDVLSVGAHSLSVLPAEGDEDLALEIRYGAGVASNRRWLDERTRVGILRGALSLRALSWLVVAGVLAVFLVLPLTTGTFGALWESGQLSQAHAFIAADCSACHAEAFTRVRDAECAACHGRVARHTAAGIEPVGFSGVRCASCHREHNGGVGLAWIDQRRCVECHGGISEQRADTEVRDVHDFETAHPEFRVPIADGAESERVEWSPDLRERPGVEFNHLRHVGQPVTDARTDEKRALDCGECHQLDAGGMRMRPVVFEESCQSCHSLAFDEAAPQRQAVHGDPDSLYDDLLDYYAGKAFREGLPGESAGAAARRRRPGAQISERDRRRISDWTYERADESYDFLMRSDEKKAPCAECHTVRRAAGSQQSTLAPVRVPTSWFAFARFPHGSHAAIPCQTCHPRAAVYDEELAKGEPPPPWATEVGGPYALTTRRELLATRGLEPSESSADILVPGIEACRQCHVGASGDGQKLASDCVLCHQFHQQANGPMR